MSKIIKLDPILANQIAAWEVVERPFSVVKELLENSIDAWATSIKVEIQEWWIQEIIITDNGNGIDESDLSLVTQKYTTSKIKNLDDLYNVMTFGFRWEALASISSVSKFQIISKKEESDFWYSLEVIDGKESNIIEHPSEKWTKIIVKELFYNTPARLNYLKKPKTEQSYISDFLKQMALSYPWIGIELLVDNKTIFQYRKSETLENRIYSVYWKDFFENSLALNVELSWIHISWYISDPKVSFGSNKKQSLFVNKRAIKSPLIFKAIKNAYNRFIPHSQYCGYVLNIQVNPTEVDVNVHPRKLEVRFANESTIFKGIYHAIQSKLESVSLIPHSLQNDESITTISNNFSHLSQEKSSPSEKQYYTGSGTKFKSYSPYKNTTPHPSQWKINPALTFGETLSNNSQPFTTSHTEQSIITDLHLTPLWTIIWQMHNSYILIQTQEWLKILDQHALAERVIYEKLVNTQYIQSTQWLLIWESINLWEEELNILSSHTKIFEEMWFEWELLSWGMILINAIPDFIKKDNISVIFTGVIQDIGKIGNTKSLTLEEVRNKIFAYTSCRSAIKFGHKLSVFEINTLLHDSALDYSATCPHWRPVVFDIDLQELQNKYER